MRLSKAEMSKDGRDFQGQFQSLYVLHLLKEDTAGYRAAEAMEAIKREHDEVFGNMRLQKLCFSGCKIFDPELSGDEGKTIRIGQEPA